MSQKLIGFTCIFFGVVFLAAKYFGWMNFLLANSWILIFWVLGFAFETAYFSNDDNKIGFLIPGGIFLTLGGIFSFCAIFGYEWMEVIWPFFIFAPAAGFIQIGLLTKSKAFAVPALVLTAVSGFFLLHNLGKIQFISTTFPFVLIIIGVLLLLTKQKE